VWRCVAECPCCWSLGLRFGGKGVETGPTLSICGRGKNLLSFLVEALLLDRELTSRGKEKVAQNR